MGRPRRKVKVGTRRLVSRSAIRKHNRKRKRSQLEITVMEWLKEEGIEFRREKAIGQCHVDIFLEPRTAIELNGCYWHGCLICNREPNKRMKLAQIKDARRYAFFRNRGFDVIVIWECEVAREPERVKALLKSLDTLRKEANVQKRSKSNIR